MINNAEIVIFILWNRSQSLAEIVHPMGMRTHAELYVSFCCHTNCNRQTEKISGILCELSICMLLHCFWYYRWPNVFIYYLVSICLKRRNTRTLFNFSELQNNDSLFRVYQKNVFFLIKRLVVQQLDWKKPPISWRVSLMWRGSNITN